MENASQQSGVMKILTYVFTVLSFVVTLLAAVLGGINGSAVGDLFNSSNANLSRKYYLDVTPESYVFGTIWPIIFIWTIVGCFYLVITLFLSPQHSPVKMQPALTPLSFFIFQTISFIFVNSWYFAFDDQSLGWSFAILFLIILNIYIAIGITLKQVNNENEKLQKNSKVTLWLVRILVQNGLLVFATWVTLATFLGFTMVLVYVDSPNLSKPGETGIVNQHTGSSISLGIILALTIVWFILENFVWEKYLRYMFTIYPVLILAFSGVIVKNQGHKDSEQNWIIGIVNLIVATVLFVIRIGLSIYRCNRRNCNAINEKESLSVDQI